MSNLLATESMGYVEKVSGMWAGGKKHYGAAEGLNPEDDVLDAEDEGAGVKEGFGSKLSSTAIRAKLARQTGVAGSKM